MVSVTPGIVSALAIAFGLLPVAYAPVAVLVGAVAAHLHAKAVQSPENERPFRP